MAGNLVKEDSSSVQGIQDPSITCSGQKRRRGSVQQASSRAGKKPKQDIDRDHREKKKLEVEKLKAETEELKNGKYKLEGQASILEKLMNGRIEENTKLKIELQRQSDSILELQKKLIALGELHQKEIQALKEQHMLERDKELNALKKEHEWQMWLIEQVNMNNPTETVPATAQATTNF
ncbi:hypothetical protein NC651_040520 [Populus alba x Populus x berolinensis]|nr:hypothetical protein NC651_040520 [Populus alba x Populus x berolinensis]